MLRGLGSLPSRRVPIALRICAGAVRRCGAARACRPARRPLFDLAPLARGARSSRADRGARRHGRTGRHPGVLDHARRRNRQDQGLDRASPARSSFWSSRSSARISAPPRAPWPISGCRGCAWSSRATAGPTCRRAASASGADRILDDAELFDTRRGRDRRLHFRAGDDGAGARPGQAGDRRRSEAAPAMAPQVAAGENVARAVRARALRARERTRSALADRIVTLAGQSGLRLAQSRAGGG